MEKQIMPEMKIISLRDIASFIGRVVSLGRTTELCLSEHKRGAAEMLDAHLDVQPELPFEAPQPVYGLPIIERTDLGQLTSRWDDIQPSAGETGRY